MIQHHYCIRCCQQLGFYTKGQLTFIRKLTKTPLHRNTSHPLDEIMKALLAEDSHGEWPWIDEEKLLLIIGHNWLVLT